MENLVSINIVSLYTALLGLLFIPITARVGLYRVKTKVMLGDGGDPEMLRRMRGQANFVETVPIALFLLFSMAAIGASASWLHALGAALVFGRLMHYIGLTEIGPAFTRAIGMVATMGTILTATCWVLYHSI